MEDAKEYEFVVFKGLDRADEVREDVNTWFGGTLAKLGCAEVKEVTVSKCKAPVKDDLASWLKDAMILHNRQHDIIKDLSSTVMELKDEYILSQQSVVELQKQVIACKDDQLQLLQKTVTSSVQSVQQTVKEEFRSYSSVIKGQEQQIQTLSPRTLDTVVKKVVKQEDRSRHVMIFGLPEETDEKLTDKVADVFSAIGEKPRVEATRLGKVNVNRERGRAVKVTLSSSAAVHQILIKARKLKTSENYGKVFICPDLSQEQRTERRQLVQEQKRRAEETPNRRHFIRSGQVHNVERS